MPRPNCSTLSAGASSLSQWPWLYKRNHRILFSRRDQGPQGSALVQRVARCVLQLLDQVQLQFGTLFRFAAAVFLDQVVASDVHGLDQRVFVRPDALPEEAIGHGFAGELRDPLQERERLTPGRRPLRLL